MAEQYGLLDKADEELHKLTGITDKDGDLHTIIEDLSSIDYQNIDWDTADLRNLTNNTVIQDKINWADDQVYKLTGKTLSDDEVSQAIDFVTGIDIEELQETGMV